MFGSNANGTALDHDQFKIVQLSFSQMKNKKLCSLIDTILDIQNSFRSFSKKKSIKFIGINQITENINTLF